MIDVVALVALVAGYLLAGYGIRLTVAGGPTYRLGRVAEGAGWLLFVAMMANMLVGSAVLAAGTGASAALCAMAAMTVRGSARRAGLPRRPDDGRFRTLRTYRSAVGPTPTADEVRQGEPADRPEPAGGDARRELMLVCARAGTFWLDYDTGRIVTLPELRGLLWPLPAGAADRTQVAWEQVWRAVDAGEITQPEAERQVADLARQAEERGRQRDLAVGHAVRRSAVLSSGQVEQLRQAVEEGVADPDCPHGYPWDMSCLPCERLGVSADAHGHRGQCPADVELALRFAGGGRIGDRETIGLPSGVNVTGRQFAALVAFCAANYRPMNGWYEALSMDERYQLLYGPMPPPRRPPRRATNATWVDHLRHEMGCDHPTEVLERMTKAELMAHWGDHEGDLR